MSRPYANLFTSTILFDLEGMHSLILFAAGWSWAGICKIQFFCAASCYFTSISLVIGFAAQILSAWLRFDCRSNGPHTAASCQAKDPNVTSPWGQQVIAADHSTMKLAQIIRQSFFPPKNNPWWDTVRCCHHSHYLTTLWTHSYW